MMTKELYEYVVRVYEEEYGVSEREDVLEAVSQLPEEKEVSDELYDVVRHNYEGFVNGLGNEEKAIAFLKTAKAEEIVKELAETVNMTIDQWVSYSD